MNQVKPWQIVLFVAAIVVLGASMWYSMRNKGPNLPNSVMVVDITNGDIFNASTRRAVFFPIRHPDTSEDVLWPIRQEEDGSWAIVDRYVSYLGEVGGEKLNETVIDKETGRVREARMTRRRIDPYAGRR